MATDLLHDEPLPRETAGENSFGQVREQRPQVRLIGGRYEYRPAAGGALVLADPPEAGWRTEVPDEGEPR